MASYPNYKCWEIMNCENLKCPARLEPETPCWEIARRFDFFNFASNICKDCIVFILKEETHVLSKKELHNMADSSSKCNFRINAEEYLIRRFKGETFPWSVV